MVVVEVEVGIIDADVLTIGSFFIIGLGRLVCAAGGVWWIPVSVARGLRIDDWLDDAASCASACCCVFWR